MQNLLGWHYPELFFVGVPGLLRSMVYAFIVVQIAGWLMKANVRLKI